MGDCTQGWGTVEAGSHFKSGVEEHRRGKPTDRAMHGLSLHITPAT